MRLGGRGAVRQALALVALVSLVGCTRLLPGEDRADGAADDLADTTVATDHGPADVPAVDVPGVDVPAMDVGLPDVAQDAAPRDAGGPECLDPTGAGGQPCYTCPPSTRLQYLNACTGARCEPFAASRLPPLDGGALPLLPMTDAGTVDVVTVDVATGDVATGDARAVDAGPALPRCAALSGGSVVYATGSTAATLFLGRVAQALENRPAQVTVVYKPAGSCVGVAAMLDAATNPMTGTATYWDPNLAVDPTSAVAQLTCALDEGGVAADLGLSDVFPTTCQDLPAGLEAAGLRDFQGPIQVMNFVVPQNASPRTISGEAAYLVYGFGATSHVVDPWTDPTGLLQRGPSSGTQALLGATIGVPRAQWFGALTASSADMVAALLAAGGRGRDVASRTLGILSSDYADRDRSQVRVLAYQDVGQSCGYWPDSTETALDKRNVRDGHYPLAGPLHLIARLNSAGALANPRVQTLVNVVTGVETLAGVDLVDIYAHNGLVPACAMRVSRASDSGGVQPFRPSNDCGCYFEERATGLVPPPGCTPCDRAADCTVPGVNNCNRLAGEVRGYCEP